MHFGHRTQNAQLHKTQRHRTLPELAPGSAINGLDASPVSASWQAAEAAFAAPQTSPPPPSQALVIVRRSRGALLAPAAPAALPGPDAVGPEADGKGPRVFRVEAALAPRSAEPMDADPALPQGHPAALTLSTSPAAHVLSRSRQVAADKAPGPVVHVVHVVHTRQLQREIETPAQRISTLTAQLAAVGPVLEAIQRAQSFCFIDEGSAKAWQQLSQQADEIAAAIQVQRK